MKHSPILSERDQLVRDWQAKRPARNTEAWGFWLIDMAHALERFDRRERWARERIFA